MANFGTSPTNQSAAPQLVVSNHTQEMAVEFLVDPTLPALGQDPFLPNTDIITIPRGRILGIVNPQTSTLPAYAQEGKALLTLANGSVDRTSGGISTDVNPIGFAETNWFRSYGERVQPYPTPVKDCVISLPYVDTSNGVYGRPKPGDYVTASFGSTTSEHPIPQELGKIVKWVSRDTFYAHTGTGSTTIHLLSAVYPAFVPRVISAWNGTAFVQITSAAYTWNTGLSCWDVTLNATATDVLFSYGQRVESRAGQMIDFEAVGNAGGALNHLHQFSGWLQWVRDNYGAWQLPPMTIPRPFSTSTSENAYANPTGVPGQYQLAHHPIVPYKTVTVNVTGTQYNNDGTTTNLTATTLPLASGTFLADYTFGLNYFINPVTGILQLDNSIVPSDISVSYSYETGYLDGQLYDAGVLGLTDGRYSGVPGTPANLELFGVLAEMKVLIF